METVVQQYHVDKKCFEIQKKQFLIENDRLLVQIISQDIVNVMNSSVDVNNSVKVNSSVDMNNYVNYVEMCNKCLEIKAELIKQHNMNNTSVNQTEPSFDQLFELNNLKAKLQAEDTTIKKLKAQIKRVNEISTSERTYKLDPVILAPKVKNNREVHEYYLKHTMEQAAILREPIQELLGYVKDTFPDIYKPKPSSSASGSKPSGNTKNDRILRTPSSNEKNKVEVHSRKVKSSLNKKNSDSKNVCYEHVKHLIKGAKALCSVCNECLFDANHTMCLINHVNSMNVRAKSASKKNKKRKEWKPTGKVFNSVGYKWKPTKRTFTLVRKACPLTREGHNLGHNLFSVGQLCDSDLEVSFRKHTCFVHKLKGIDLHSGSRGTNLYPLSFGDMMAASPICLLSKATKTKSWLWHHRLSHLNFSAINHLVRHGLVRGLPRLKYEKDHLCSACAMGKSKKQSHTPKSEDTNQEKLYLLHMDLCGPMCVASVNRKKYILVIIDDFSRSHGLNAAVKNIPIDNGTELDLVFQPVFDEFFSPPASVAFLVPIEEAPAPVESTGSLSLITVDQDAPSPSTSQTTPHSQSQTIPFCAEEESHDLEVAHMSNDPYFGISIPETISKESSSSDVISTTVHSDPTISEHLSKWTISTRLQLHEQALFYLYDAFLTSVEPKMYKEALTQSCWIEAIQEELHEFERLEAPHAWYDLFSLFMLSQGFSKGTVDPTLFISRKGKDILLISQSPRGIFLNQSKYALESLKKYIMKSCDPVDSSMVEKSKLCEDTQGKAIDLTHYRGMVGTLMYLTSSRPDLGLWYSNDSAIALTAFANADHAGCQDTRRSTSGSMQFLGDRLVSWSSKRQKSAMISSMEAKYVALSGCCAQVLWMRSQLTDYGLGFNKIPIYHIMKEQVESGVVELYYVRMEYQLANIFTKALCRERIEFLINKLGMRSFTPETLKELADKAEEYWILNQDFIAPPSKDLVTLIQELDYSGRCNMLSVIHTDQMHQPWRTFDAIINRCISGKTIGLDKLREPRAQILWDDNKEISSARKEHMPYPRFTKVIINHLISKDKTISKRNKINLCTIGDDSLLAYKTYYDFATGKVPPRKARRYKKVYSLPRKLPPIKEAKPVKKGKRPTAGVVLRDTPGMSVSKKKAPAIGDRSKGIDILFDVALSEAAQLKEATKRSKKDFHISQGSGSGDGTYFESGVPDEQTRKTSGTDEGTCTIPGVPDVPEYKSKSDNESWGDSENENDDEDDNNNNSDDANKGDDDEADNDDDGDDTHDSERTDSGDDDENPSFTLKYYDEDEHDKEHESDDDYENMFKEENDDDLYKDVEVRLLGTEHEKERKDDEEMTNAD
ncbi:retrovirus-related pol polyprotein from transposon TNT 1-94 [Tanacetum coccineum]